ncbi:DUF423 domain-containing protein [cyanobacterium endosymbiont of Epithemia clementina EcSB]|uniref:DUF423 domain-containing protein n=1 Tax=cyanobacterium endosymbiont of Epithemia clementina EcSB TaxID=3034674 RepID=UPI00248080DF|nr:DUF423 domain-containing protein [cyanobacterium endosymbiont of Epithemia clementina EcSB]WGT68155.1 DUF423 domain-containing protein [cyanobacterium endosymbiont of Epithemia clementina EcSB]
MVKVFMIVGSTLAGLGVAGGAFARHSLKNRLSAHALDIFETGIKYQMYHSLALLLVVLLLTSQQNYPSSLLWAGYGFILGMLIFSGSLYALSLTGIKWLGAITPIGGMAFMIGWGSLVITAWNWK